MDDIVTRLRDVGFCGWDAQQEAADEIEQLRAEVNTMACAQDGWGQVARLKAENERLRKEIDLMKKESHVHC